MGYVGIPSAILFADNPNYEFVYGIQRSSESSSYKIDALNSGKSPLKGEEPGLEERLSKVVREKKFTCTSDYSVIKEVDAVTLAIQTPFANSKDLIPDYSSLGSALEEAAKYITKGVLVVIESTITPGTTETYIKPILDKNPLGLTAGEDFGLAHAPERVMVGRLLKNIQEHDRIIGGIDESSTSRALELIRPILTKGQVIPMTSTAAEVTKTAENTFRDLQIAAVNQLALYCEAMGINVFDVRKGIASLKGEGITRAILNPGAGVGGHCLTKDTYHLERGIKVIGGDLDFPDSTGSLFIEARKINDFMPSHMVHLTEEALGRIHKLPNTSKIALLGWAFINNSDDARNTPSEIYHKAMIQKGAEITIHDPYVEKYPGVQIEKNLDSCLKNADVIAIFTAHTQYYSLSPEILKPLMQKKHPVLIDGRNCVDPDLFINNGFIYKGIGRGDKNIHPIKEEVP